MRTEKYKSRKNKVLKRTIVTSLQWSEKDALLIRGIEAIEDLADSTRESLEILKEMRDKFYHKKK